MKNLLLAALALGNTATDASEPKSAVVGPESQTTGIANAAIDFAGFVRLAQEVQPIRQQRRVGEEEFLRMAAEPGTLVLDTRSAAAYAEVHVRGAIHLNFSDITKERITEVIPDKSTRVLIYCNNNFVSPRTAFMDKRVSSALNIPTFITLYDYGYRNVYELGPRVDEKTTKLELVSSAGKD